MNVDELIETTKARTGLSQAKIAKEIGISAPSLSELKNGKGELSDETYIKLAELAGVDPAEVILEKHMRKAGPAAAAVWAKAKRGLEALKGGVTKLRIMATSSKKKREKTRPQAKTLKHSIIYRFREVMECTRSRKSASGSLATS
ncbi:MAG: helix-turn-helix domain-containing protein [Acidithiobacillus ferriphilus]